MLAKEVVSSKHGETLGIMSINFFTEEGPEPKPLQQKRPI